MRTSAIGFFYSNEADVLSAARKFAEVTHNHPEGIKGAQATSFAIFLARQGNSKEEIRNDIANMFQYVFRSAPGMRSALNMFLMNPARAACRRRSPLFWSRRILRTLFAKRFRWAETRIRWHALPAPLLKLFMEQIPPEIEAEVMKRLPEEFIRIIDKFYLMLEG